MHVQHFFLIIISFAGTALGAAFARRAGQGYPKRGPGNARQELLEVSPIAIREFESRSIYIRATTNAFTDTSMQTKESWYWGDASNPQVNLTGQAMTDNKRMLSMERFVDSLKYVECPEGQVQFTFKDQASFNRAHSEWDWINQDSSHYAMLVTDNDACVSDIAAAGTSSLKGVNTNGHRQPHVVNRAAFVPSSMTAVFYGQSEDWVTALGDGASLRIKSDGILPQGSQNIASSSTSQSTTAFQNSVSKKWASSWPDHAEGGSSTGAQHSFSESAHEIVSSFTAERTSSFPYESLANQTNSFSHFHHNTKPQQGEKGEHSYSHSEMVPSGHADTYTYDLGSAHPLHYGAASSHASPSSSTTSQGHYLTVAPHPSHLPLHSDGARPDQWPPASRPAPPPSHITDPPASPADLDKRLDLGVSTNVPISIAHDFSGTIISENFQGIDVALQCSDCTTRGVFNFDIIAEVGKDKTINLTTTGVGASFTFSLTLSGELTSADSKSVSLLNFPLPGGLSIAGIADVGPTLAIEAGASIGPVSAEASLNFGVDISINDDSFAFIDFDDASKNAHNDFVPQFKPIGPSVDASVTVTGSVGPQIALELEAELLSKGFAAGLLLKAPTLDLTLSAQAEVGGQGVCGGTDAAGITFDVGVAGELDAFGGAGAVTDFPNSVALLSTSVDLFSTCIGIAGAAPPPTTATTAATPAVGTLSPGVPAGCTSIGQTVAGGVCAGAGPGGSSFVVDPVFTTSVAPVPEQTDITVTSNGVTITELTTLPVTTATEEQGGSLLITTVITQELPSVTAK